MTRPCCIEPAGGAQGRRSLPPRAPFSAYERFGDHAMVPSSGAGGSASPRGRSSRRGPAFTAGRASPRSPLAVSRCAASRARLRPSEPRSREPASERGSPRVFRSLRGAGEMLVPTQDRVAARCRPGWLVAARHRCLATEPAAGVALSQATPVSAGQRTVAAAEARTTRRRLSWPGWTLALQIEYAHGRADRQRRCRPGGGAAARAARHAWLVAVRAHRPRDRRPQGRCGAGSQRHADLRQHARRHPPDAGRPPHRHRAAAANADPTELSARPPAASANAAGRRSRRSLVAELLPPVVRAAFTGEIEEIPERFERADVSRFLIAVRWGVEEL